MLSSQGRSAHDEALATFLVRTMSYAMHDESVAFVTVDEANRRPAALRAFLRGRRARV